LQGETKTMFGSSSRTYNAALGGKVYSPERSLQCEADVSGAPRGSVWRLIVSLSCLICFSTSGCFAADIALIDSGGHSSIEQRKFALAAQFYGVNIDHVSPFDVKAIRRGVEHNSLLAVAVEANDLPFVNRSALLHALRRKSGASIPLLIFGVNEQVDAHLLSDWSDGEVGGVQFRTGSHLNYLVGDISGFTQQLTGVHLPFAGEGLLYFAVTKPNFVRTIIQVDDDTISFPTFLELDNSQNQIFLVCNDALGAISNNADLMESFAELSPDLMFIKYVAGSRAWHMLHQYANLTIDDPWLHEPYGGVSYKKLLTEMEEHNFHTTIAFIPWNYDRSEKQVVELFRQHPERFSICVHGDNHDHKEFDDLADRPLSVQSAALRQSIARMERFHDLTRIPYDPVFVFPHNIGSVEILKELKKYNFLATVNSSNVPGDSQRPHDPLFALRPVTLGFGDFASITRFPAGLTNRLSFLAVQSYLDNPLFFYVHQDFFLSSTGAFNAVADDVNRREPNVRWCNLGEILRHLYLVKLRDNGDYDLLTFSPAIDVENTSGRTSTFAVRKRESGSPAIWSVQVDGESFPFQQSDGYLNLSLSIPPGQTRSVTIRYKNDLELASIDPAAGTFRVYLLRKTSDFRDMTLSEYAPGRALTSFYYRHFYYRHDKWARIVILLLGGLFILICGAGWSVLQVARSRRIKSKSSYVHQNPETRMPRKSPVS